MIKRLLLVLSFFLFYLGPFYWLKSIGEDGEALLWFSAGWIPAIYFSAYIEGVDKND